MTRLTRLTKDDVMRIAVTRGEFVVEQFGYRHMALRKTVKKLCQEGRLEMVFPEGYKLKGIILVRPVKKPVDKGTEEEQTSGTPCETRGTLND